MYKKDQNCVGVQEDECPLHQLLGESPFDYALTLIGGKWKMRILFSLLQNKVMRYGELKRAITPITHKMLASQLKELEVSELIIRKEYPQVPPKVEYSLSDKGKDLESVVFALGEWLIRNYQIDNTK